NTTSRTTSRTHIETIETERQRDLETKNKTRPKKLAEPPSDADLLLASDWSEFARSKKVTPDAQKYADAIRKTRTSMGLSESEMREIFHFVEHDEFWCQNAISPAGLLVRSKNNALRKIENIRVSMTKAKPKKQTQGYQRDINHDDEL